MDMIGKVKRMHFRDHLSFSDIARRTGLSRNTVKKRAKSPVEVEPRYRRGTAAGSGQRAAGSPRVFHEALIQSLRIDLAPPCSPASHVVCFTTGVPSDLPTTHNHQ